MHDIAVPHLSAPPSAGQFQNDPPLQSLSLPCRILMIYSFPLPQVSLNIPRSHWVSTSLHPVPRGAKHSAPSRGRFEHSIATRDGFQYTYRLAGFRGNPMLQSPRYSQRVGHTLRPAGAKRSSQNLAPSHQLFRSFVPRIGKCLPGGGSRRTIVT